MIDGNRKRAPGNTGQRKPAVVVISVTLPDGAPASSNAQLVEHAVRLGAALGRSPMTPTEARRLLR